MSEPFDPKSLADLHSAMAAHVDRSELTGLVTLLARGDEIHVDAIGTTTVHGSSPMRRDTIFRIASLTKPITAAATMILVEDGRLALDDSVEPWLPELANRRVLRSIESELDDTVPAVRAITVRDLLTSTFGFGSVMAAPGTYPIQTPIHEGVLGGDGPEYMLHPPEMNVWIRRLGELPLMYQPGERWTYNVSFDVLGVLIARVTGTSFGTFLKERLFVPLGMRDTGFSVPTPKLDRLPGCYRTNQATKALEVFDAEVDSAWSRPPAFESGAGGLVSTADDVLAFCRMMLNGGTLDGTRILHEESVAAMTRDQLEQGQREGAEIFFRDETSWGYGMSVNIGGSNAWNVPGRFGWDGGFGTSAYSDPKNDFVGILLSQLLMDSPEAPALYEDFWSKAYATVRP